MFSQNSLWSEIKAEIESTFQNLYFNLFGDKDFLSTQSHEVKH